jgi:polar amino acid transport system permease protein
MQTPFQIKDLWFLAQGSLMTLWLSAVSVALGGLVAVPLGMLQSLQRPKVLIWLTRLYIEIFRGTPLLLQLFLAYFGLSIIGINVDRFTAAALALTCHTSAYMGEIILAGIRSIGKGQWEAGRSLGMSYLQIMRHVVGPQAIRVMLPPSIGFLAQLIKGTSLVVVLGYVELSKVGNILVLRTYQPLLIYSIVAVFYFALCYPVSLYGRYLERRLRLNA